MKIKKAIEASGLTLLIGILVPLIYLVFTNFVHFMQELIWFDIAKTDENKLAIIPLSILGGVVLSGALLINKKIMGRELSHEMKEIVKDTKITPKLMLATFIIGAISLIGGASLGPEAILLPISYGLGYLFASKLKIDNPSAFGMIAIVSLLASFFNGYAAAILPIGLMAIKMVKSKSALIMFLVLGSVAAIISVATLRLLGDTEGYVKLPFIAIENINFAMLATALFVGFIAAYASTILHWVANQLKKIFNVVPKNWLVQGLVAGLGVGIIYYLLGPVGFFSGHTALETLINDNSEYTSFQLAGLAAGKLLVTAWCVATIYRGGVIYPLLVVGLSLALLFVGAFPDSTWLVTLLVATFVGAFSGNFKSAIIGAAFVLPLFGIGSITLVIAAVLGSTLALNISKLTNRDKLATQ